MHDPMMAQIGMDHHQEQHNGHEKYENFAGNEGWVDINNNYSSPQTHSPVYEQQHGGDLGSIGFVQPFQQAMPTAPHFNSQRMPQPLPAHTTHQQLLPLIMPSHPTWPSMLTNPASYSTAPVAIPASAPPLVKGSSKAHGVTPSPRKTLTDNDRRRMCQYHEDNPSVKQTEIGALFGVERRYDHVPLVY
ncbi:hypothetical protein B0O99DRAFT_144067 [Bisporella sp. PMI_857]|nr:hypothetical protein B0O99DRAFT_144067 [Bisporella sp. PMI_857]